jgi:integrase/recombinase XerD
VPPGDPLPYRSWRLAPYLYSDDEIAAVTAAAGRLPNPKLALSYQTIIGLLAATGIRVGEALRLNLDDVHWEQRLLMIHESKFGKSRLVPLEASTFAALGEYVRQRKDALSSQGDGGAIPLLLWDQGLPLQPQRHVHQLTREIGLEPRSRLCRPRIHDLRHSFAIRTMLDWYRADVDVQSWLPLLSTYLGHVNPATTYWYLSAAPELLALAGERLERHLEEHLS